VAFAEFVFVEMRNGHSDVLFFSAGVGEAEVDKLDFVLLHHLHHVCDGLGCHQVSPGWMVVENLGWGFECSFYAKAGAWLPPRSPAIVPDVEAINRSFG
jgi:hypothetical protein